MSDALESVDSTSTDPSSPASSAPASAVITVFWRPGCGFCSGLFRQFDQLNVPYDAVNIWDDPAGAAFVRSVDRGNETVPTVLVGSVALVNPSIREVLDAAVTHAPAAVPLGFMRNRR
jgi:mycoredoxin